MDDPDDQSSPRMEVIEQSTVPHNSEQDTVGWTPPGSKKSRLWLIILLVVGILLVLGGTVYWLLSAKHQSPAQASSQDANQQQTQQEVQPDTVTDSTSGEYVSKGADLNLTFSYPGGWAVVPASGDNSDDQPITVTSPLLDLTKADGSTVTGKIIVTIRPGSSEITELAPGTATAAAASEQIAYKKPTKNQHQYPYITFIHLTGGKNPSGEFEEVMITGIHQFAKGQGITSYSLGQLDPIISAQFYQCKTQACSGAGLEPLSVTYTMWQNDSTLQEIQALFESLQLR